MRKLLAYVAIGAFLKTQLALAANIPLLSGAATADPSQMQATINGVIQTINSSISGTSFTFGRNLLDNGDMWVNQRNSTATCGTTTTTNSEASYSADRWMCNVNQASGAGQLAVATSSPTPPQGFINESTLVRNTASLGQPVCAWQEVQTQRATAMAGQNVAFSVNIQPLAGLSADNGNTAFLVVETGTTAGGADGLGGLRTAVGMTATVKQSSATISTSTGIITNTSAVVAGVPIYFGAATAPSGITLGQIYYVSSANLTSGTSFAVAPTYAQAIAGTNTVIPSTAGATVTVTLPKITPAWTGLNLFSAGNSTGLASGVGLGAAIANQVTLSSAAWTRVSTGLLSMPSNMTEAAVAVCFAPNSATSGGSTDGIAFTGAQLEILGPNVTSASTYEFRSPQQEWADALRYYYEVTEPATGLPAFPSAGTLLTTTTCQIQVPFMESMDIAPTGATIGTLSTSTFQIVVAADTSTLASTFMTYGTNTTTSGNITAKLTTASTAGWACLLQGQGASGSVNGISFGSDF